MFARPKQSKNRVSDRFSTWSTPTPTSKINTVSTRSPRITNVTSTANKIKKTPHPSSPQTTNLSNSPDDRANNRQELFESLLNHTHYTEREMYETLKQLKSLILSDGIPDLPRSSNSQTLRCRIWKILLGVYQSSATEYVSYIEKGRSHFYDKIRNDTFRTLATDKRFLTDVGENKLIRVLNAFVWKHEKKENPSAYNWQFTYVQGMNVLAAPFLYALPEVDAFHTFDTFLQYSCPLYVQPALQGVHCGLKLLDMCLKILDLKLYTYLREKNLSAEIYAFPSVLTFCVCTPPLNEAIRLWDFLLSFGIHLNILCIVAQLQFIREEILVSSSPMKLLRTLPDLNARAIITATTRLARQLPQDVYRLLSRHTYDPLVIDEIIAQKRDTLPFTQYDQFEAAPRMCTL